MDSKGFITEEINNVILDKDHENTENNKENENIEILNAYQFILNHRKILESDKVSKNINKWFDLIFGYKQRGKEAEESLNLFLPSCYENDFDFSSLDPDELMIKMRYYEFGICPRQIVYPKPFTSKILKENKKQVSEAFIN